MTDRCPALLASDEPDGTQVGLYCLRLDEHPGSHRARSITRDRFIY